MNQYKYIFILASIFCFSTSNGQNADSVLRANEITFLLDKYKSIVPDYLRGVDSSVWNDKVKQLYEKAKSAKTHIEYIYSLRYFSALLNDEHASFPDGGFYNRNRFINKYDSIFPVTVRNYKDGRSFVIRDYTGTIPAESELLTVNGLNVRDISLLLEELYPAERRYAFPYMNYSEQPDVRSWCILTIHLFMEGIKPPFITEYRLRGDTIIRSAALPAMSKGDIYKAYKKSGDKRRNRKKGNFAQKPVEYRKINDSIALLDINLLWGKNPLTLLFSQSDNRYERLLRRAMKLIAEQKCKHLIIDIRGNPGGYIGNVFHTMSYLATDTLREYTWYKVSKESKENALPVIRNTYKLLYGNERKAAQEESVRIFLNMPEGSLFRADTLLPIIHVPSAGLKHRYHGKVYVLSDALSYSGSILFCELIRQTKRGELVGESPGGFVNVRGGMRAPVKVPNIKYEYMKVPYSVSSCFSDFESGNDYVKLDYEIEPSLDEWLDNNDGVLMRLIRKIKLCRND